MPLAELEWRWLFLTLNSSFDPLLSTQSNRVRTQNQVQASCFDLEVPRMFPQKLLSILQGNKRGDLLSDSGSGWILILFLGDNLILYVTLLLKTGN